MNINLNLFKISNLNDFKVEELEQRLEMRKWYVEGSVSGGCTGSDCNFTGTGTVGYQF